MFLNIYSQWTWHDECYIVGDTKALFALRDAINQAIGSGQGCTTVFSNDGEGYYVAIVKKDEDFDKMANPYHGLEAEESRTNAIWPEQLAADIISKTRLNDRLKSQEDWLLVQPGVADAALSLVDNDYRVKIYTNQIKPEIVKLIEEKFLHCGIDNLIFEDISKK